MNKQIPSTDQRTNRVNSRGMAANEILAQAVAIADAEGLDRLTIRRLATETNLGTMTLYNYFSNKRDLLQHMAAYVLSRFQAPTRETIDVKEYIRRLTHAWHDMMIEHPTIVQLILQQVTSHPSSRLVSFERPLSDLRSFGLTGEQAVRVFGFTVTYALGFSAYQLPRPWGFEADMVPDTEEQRRQQSLLIQSLPIQDYPTMVENSDAIVSLPTKTQFEWGLEMFLAGFDDSVASSG